MNRGASKDLEGLSILVVEDEAFIAFALQKTMLNAGAVHVDTARTLAMARSLVCMRRWDVVFLDLRLPDGSSHGLAEELSKMGTAVVIHSGNAESATMAQLPNCSHCPKPATVETILQVIKSAVSARSILSR